MAKSFRWDETYGSIYCTGGTSSDVVTFKDITDNCEANPFPTYVMPKLYGGSLILQGDTTTFTGSAGDKLKVTINGVVYDDIDVATATSITAVVSRINTATTNYYNLTGFVVASVASSNLRLTALCNDAVGDVTIADGTSTVNPCVQKLFNTATRTASTTTGAYELTENNASEWSGLNGMGTPSNSTTNVVMNSYNIASTVSSIPTGTSITRVDGTSSPNISVYMANTSGFAVGDEVQIIGTTNFNLVIFRIVTVTTNQRIIGYRPRNVPAINETGISGATVIKQLMLGWNDNYGRAYTTINSISMADNIKFSLSSTCTGTPKLKAVIIRNYLGSGNPAGFEQGCYIPVNLDIPLSGAGITNYTLNIRDGVNWQWNANTTARGYWGYFSKLYFVFDGLAVGETIYLDGVRFTGNINSIYLSENNYVIHSGITVPSGCWFKDFGFNVRVDLLDCVPKQLLRGVFDFTAANLGECQLGDYSGGYTDKEGGVINYNTFCMEDTGYGAAFLRVQCQGIMFKSFKNQYGGFSFFNCSNNNYRNCTWINMLNFFQSENGTTFKDCVSMGGRYNFAFPPAGIVIDGFTTYATSTRNFYIRASTTAPSLKGIKIIDDQARNLILADTYSSTATAKQGVRFVNLDMSETNSSSTLTINNLALHNPYTVEVYVAMSFKPIITDENGEPLQSASVKLCDKNDVCLFKLNTDANGTITEQTVDIISAIAPASTNMTFYFSTPLTNWTASSPFSLEIAADGYETYNQIILPDTYSVNDEYCKNGFNDKIQLKPIVPIRILAGDGVSLALQPELGSSSLLKKV